MDITDLYSCNTAEEKYKYAMEYCGRLLQYAEIGDGDAIRFDDVAKQLIKCDPSFQRISKFGELKIEFNSRFRDLILVYNFIQLQILKVGLIKKTNECGKYLCSPEFKILLQNISEGTISNTKLSTFIKNPTPKKLQELIQTRKNLSIKKKEKMKEMLRNLPPLPKIYHVNLEELFKTDLAHINMDSDLVRYVLKYVLYILDWALEHRKDKIINNDTIYIIDKRDLWEDVVAHINMPHKFQVAKYDNGDNQVGYFQVTKGLVVKILNEFYKYSASGDGVLYCLNKETPPVPDKFKKFNDINIHKDNTGPQPIGQCTLKVVSVRSLQFSASPGEFNNVED